MSEPVQNGTAAVQAAITAAKVKAAELPRSREQALVLTKLDEAELWLKWVVTT